MTTAIALIDDRDGSMRWAAVDSDRGSRVGVRLGAFVETFATDTGRARRSGAPLPDWLAALRIATPAEIAAWEARCGLPVSALFPPPIMLNVRIVGVDNLRCDLPLPFSKADARAFRAVVKRATVIVAPTKRAPRKPAAKKRRRK